MQTYRLYNKLIIHVLNISIFCQDMTVELPDSIFQPVKELVPTPPTNNIVQEAIKLDQEIIQNTVPGAGST